MKIRFPKCPNCGERLSEIEKALTGNYECEICGLKIKPSWFSEELRLLNPESPKVFVLDGAKIKSMDDFYDEVQRVLCPLFKGFGRNWSAFSDVLRGGFGVFELNENIHLRFINAKQVKASLSGSQFDRIIRIIKETDNVKLIL